MLKSELFYGLVSILFSDLILRSLLKHAYLAESTEDPLFILFELRIFLYFIGIIKGIFLYFTGTKKEHEG